MYFIPGGFCNLYVKREAASNRSELQSRSSSRGASTLQVASAFGRFTRSKLLLEATTAEATVEAKVKR